MISEAETERIALATELPFGTVARVLQAHAGKDGPVAPFDLVAFLEDLTAWQLATFGPRQTITGVIDHMRKELETEIVPAPHDRAEWIGLLNLVVSALTKTGATPRQIADLWREQFTLLQARSWPDWRTQDPDRAIEHVRSAKPEPDILTRLRHR